MEQLKKLFEKYKTDKKLMNLLIMFVFGVILLIAGGTLMDNPSPKTTKTDQANTQKVQKDGDLNIRLESILSQIKGAGQVSVMVHLIGGKEIVTASDLKKGETVTEEKDSGGGLRKVTQTDTEQKVVMTGSQAAPVVVKELEPMVQGVIVLSDGASDPAVKEALHEAAKTVLGIPAYKVQVFEKKRTAAQQ
ncbi:MAG: stage III sporulation protein AG [Hyphomonadaceae bacterium]|nr:stage III sporulation protein AG [Clostridia bacterium]